MISRLKKLSPEFRNILKISSETAFVLGYRIYLVGGVVRDLILGREVFDLDIVVEGDAIALSRNLAEKLASPFRRHHAFGTATLMLGPHKIDFATARTEYYIHPGALPKVQQASLSQDLFRRDFTINAMAISLNKDDYGQLVDLYQGMSDLKNKTLRILHEKSFRDDPTRIFRAVRFEQRFSFRIEPFTFSLMKKALAENVLSLVNPHRLRNEIKLILQEPKPVEYIRRLNEITKFTFISPEITFTKKHFDFFKRIEAALIHYRRKYKKQRACQSWLVYLGAILLSVPRGNFERILHDFGFKKGEQIILRSMREGLKSIGRLSQTVKPHVLYRSCSVFSFEALLFFYAYYPQKMLRKNIDYFLEKQISVTLSIRGNDLKQLGLKPESCYGRVFQRLLNRKLDYGFSSKDEELKAAKALFKVVANEIYRRK